MFGGGSKLALTRSVCRSTCDTATTLLTVLVLTRSGMALADERLFIPLERGNANFGASIQPMAGFAAAGVPAAGVATAGVPAADVPASFALPESYLLRGVPPTASFSADEFRPRGHAAFDASLQRPLAEPLEQATPLASTTVWQRLREFRSQGRVRLLTLWEAGGSSISLQAGKKGEPSLQWSSRSSKGGGASRGVFDHVVAVSLARASRGAGGAAHGGSTEVSKGPVKMLEAAGKK
jgi:hypothetical protein